MPRIFAVVLIGISLTWPEDGRRSVPVPKESSLYAILFTLKFYCGYFLATYLLSPALATTGQGPGPRKLVMQRGKSRTYPAWVAEVLDRPIVLVGLMGAGKSSIGRLLAARLGLEFVDADSEIESAAGATIEEIFETHGEEFFRSGERRVIARLLTGPVRVIATGGGAFIDDDTRQKIKASGLSVWLKADTETLLKRVSRRGGRPLLKGVDPRQVMTALTTGRDPLYAEADITVETSENPPAEVTERVIAAVAAHFGVEPPPRPRRAKANGAGTANRENGGNPGAKPKSGKKNGRRRRPPRPSADTTSRAKER